MYYVLEVEVVFQHKYIFVHISTSCGFFALKLGDMSLLIIFYCHTKLQLDPMSTFGDFRGWGKIEYRLHHPESVKKYQLF